MRRIFAKRWFRVAGAALLLVALVALGCAWHFRIWNWRDYVIYREMSRECDPVWRELHFGDVHAGQDVEEVIAKTKPARVGRYGRYVDLEYQAGLCFTGVTIIAKDGRLASAGAWSCTWNRVFFDELTDEDQRAFHEAYEAHWAPIRKMRGAE